LLPRRRAGLASLLLLAVAFPPVSFLLGLDPPPNVVFAPLTQARLLLRAPQLEASVHVVGTRHGQVRRRGCGRRRLVLVLFFIFCVDVRPAFVLFGLRFLWHRCCRWRSLGAAAHREDGELRALGCGRGRPGHVAPDAGWVPPPPLFLHLPLLVCARNVVRVRVAQRQGPSQAASFPRASYGLLVRVQAVDDGAALLRPPVNFTQMHQRRAAER
jgi:hypothetical protein